jgi:hypothetical protein
MLGSIKKDVKIAMTGEQVRILKEATTDYFKVLYRIHSETCVNP